MFKSDKIIFGSVLCAFFPFVLSVIVLGIGFCFVKEDNLPYFFITGIITGIILDIIFIRRILSVLFDQPFWVFAGFYILCSVLIYGAFMGLPVPQLVVGLAAGYYWGRRISVKNIISPQLEVMIRKVTFFSAFIMLLICISSALLALNEKTIGEELQGMLGLGFIPGKDLIIGGIIIGGSALIIIQYFITRIMIVKTAKTRIG
jgi:hypothetical protein